MTTKIRAEMDRRKTGGAGAKVMLLNAYGYGMLSLMAAFDGTFSEGSAINAVGLLAVQTPAILWTYGPTAWAANGFDQFAQTHLYMGVFPMAPFPVRHCHLRV